MTTVTREPGEKLVWLGPTRTQELEAPLTDAERAGLNAQVAAVSQETFALEEEKKAVVAPINERLKDAKARERGLLETLAGGTMPKPVAVRTRADLFRGEKWVVRLDTEEEVPETRCALTDGERQLMIPGVTVPGGRDERPDAPVVDLFSVQGGAAEDVATVTWAQLLAPPLERWKVEKVGTAYQLVDTRTWQVFGPFDYVHGQGLVVALSEETQAKLEKEAGGGLQMAALLADTGDAVRAHFTSKPAEPWEVVLPEPHAQWTVSEPWPGQYLLTENTDDGESWGPYPWADGAIDRVETLSVPEADLETLREHVGDDAAQSLLDAAEDAIREHRTTEAEAARHAAVPEHGLDLHRVEGTGWWLYVHDGYGYLRPPNVDRFTPPGDAADKGPMEWDTEGNHWEVADKAPPELDEWVRENGSVLVCADSLVKLGKVTLPAAGKPLSPGEAAAGRAADEDVDTAAMARKLSDSARAVLRLLAEPDAPTDAPTIGSRCRCKAGSVLNGLEAKGLVERGPVPLGSSSEAWRITETGRAVAAALPPRK